MKRRMCVSRCCCAPGGELVIPTLGFGNYTTHDNLSQPTPPHELNPYASIGAPLGIQIAAYILPPASSGPFRNVSSMGQAIPVDTYTSAIFEFVGDEPDLPCPHDYWLYVIDANGLLSQPGSWGAGVFWSQSGATWSGSTVQTPNLAAEVNLVVNDAGYSGTVAVVMEVDNPTPGPYPSFGAPIAYRQGNNPSAVRLIT